MRVVLAMLALCATAEAAAAPAAPCRFDSARWLASDLFRRYPADPAPSVLHAPDVTHGEARRYRTVLALEGDARPDLAGHIRVVRIGCGAGAICPAFVDRADGHVVFARALRVVEWDDALGGGGSDDRLYHRRDSRLLVVVGVRNEDPASGGIAYYDWRRNGPRLVRFVPTAQVCGQEDKR